MMHRRAVLILALAVFANAGAAFAQMTHEHKKAKTCSDLTLSCASSATPAFAADGALWVAARVGDAVIVAKSLDRGRSFAPAATVTRDAAKLDEGADAGPKIVVDKEGDLVVAYAALRDKKYNGQVFYARSVDGGRTFSAPAPMTSNNESQRFAALAIDSDGAVFAAWLDKRNRALKKDGETYSGAGVAFAWSGDAGASFSEARIAHEGTCECCRLDIAFAGRGRPVVLFRNMFDMSVRDHAIMTFADRETPGPVYRVSIDDWEINACPHQGPTLAVTPDGAYHAAWFTGGRARKGLFYARSLDGGRSFSDPSPIGDPDHMPSRPSLLSAEGKLWLAWKEFDGEQTTVKIMASHDNGETWSAPKTIAATSEDSDHPILVSDGRRAFLSWQTLKDGYHLLALEDAS